ncbi:MAG: hypothetical protein HGB32_09600 [Geobacteraceae bacterium]|nr:hypothetical protein [Geobacteraceae bacterium]NTW80388.1 hypothetical protein [Geobacteraceae bacterium]
MQDSDQTPDILPKRLCSEIQLFDLCDLDSCASKNGRFCTDSLLLDRFEKIAEKELVSSDSYIAEEIDDEEAADNYGYDEEDEFAADDLDDCEDDCWEEK